MDVIEADSQAIDWFAYEEGRLFIRFASGGLYRYDGVPGDVYGAMLAAPSLGRFFHEHVLDRYPYERLV